MDDRGTFSWDDLLQGSRKNSSIFLQPAAELCPHLCSPAIYLWGAAFIRFYSDKADINN